MSKDNLPQDHWARLRFSIIGPLFSAPPPPGDLQAALYDNLAVVCAADPPLGPSRPVPLCVVI